MRLRERRRIEKRARIAAHQWPQFAGAGPEELLSIAAQPDHGWYIRGEAIRLLGSKTTPGFLLEEFFAGQTELEIWEAALTMEHAGRPDVIAPMIGALHDSNHHRRQAAARVLGWNGRSRATSAKALLSVLKDQAQPQAVRSETCESLAYLNWRPSVPALVAATKEDDPRIRFWAAFGLGGMRDRITGDISPQVIGPLEALLDDRSASRRRRRGSRLVVRRQGGAEHAFQLDPEISRYRNA